jgi:hypothetical protein
MTVLTRCSGYIAFTRYVFNQCHFLRNSRSVYNAILWDVTPCSSIEIHRRFEGTYCFHFSAKKMSPALLVSHVPLKLQWTSTGLHGVTSQEIVVFIVTVAITSAFQALLWFSSSEFSVSQCKGWKCDYPMFCYVEVNAVPERHVTHAVC